MNYNKLGETLLVILIVAIAIVLSILWTSHQWNVCMDKIGDFWYCVQHIS